MLQAPAISNTDHCKVLSHFITAALGCVWKNTLTPARMLQAYAVLNPGHYSAAMGCVWNNTLTMVPKNTTGTCSFKSRLLQCSLGLCVCGTTH